ncbi:MAG TPA: glucoamylase family protein [Caldimonas sp.]
MPQLPSDLPITIRSSPTWWQRIVPAAGEIEIEDPPLRAELFSAEQIASHGERLAKTHVLRDAPLPDRLLPRLADNERVLVAVAKQLAVTADADRRHTPAAEWLLDNFYLIEEEVRTARRHLPRGYSRKLPRLALAAANGGGAGLPRVYDLALQAIAHGDGQIGRGTLSRFVAAYQSVQPLRLGELWAFPIMLRLALLENLRRVAVRIEVAHVERDTAGAWADSMVAVAENSPSDLILVIADMARSGPLLTNAFVAEFARRLQGRGAALMLALQWIEQRLAESGQSIEQLVQLEARQQAANQVSVSNSIGSLRLLGAMDWSEFVESLSSVEQTLRGDPGGVYTEMDFATRDHYRHAIEEIAALSPTSELDVARNAVALAEAAAASADAGAAGDPRQRHVGFYLLGAGRERLEQAVHARLPRRIVLARKAKAWALPLYAGTIAAFTLILVARLMLEVRLGVDWPWWGEALFALGLVVATSQLAVSLANWLVTLFVQPQTLPRMDYGDGIAAASRALVVVPTMLGSPDAIESLVEALEVRFLANRDPHLHYGLLTDFHDAADEHLAGDDALVELVAARIAALNEKYANNTGVDPFFLFHRPRRWNPRERVWMGYERKRGKLGDLNALLRGHEPAHGGERFSRVVGRTAALHSVRYVITLDSDTQLPRDAAAKIVATMAHPLNRPRFGKGVQRDIVVDGYGILQPRVGLSLPSTNRSGYARLYGGEPGIDPYTRAVSDVYQDLFGEGSFIGKGIYDVDAFERALHDRMPENRILSHDLIEGCHARSGLLSDVQLLEESPTRYSADVARRYRWIRGDWQLLGWLRRRVHTLPGAPRNPLSLLSRAKILDNLRRSLAPLAMVATLLAAWALLPPSPVWSIVVLAIIGGVPLAAFVVGTLLRPLEPAGSGEPTVAAPASRQVQNLLIQVAQSLACLPHEAAYSVAAIARTLWRVAITKRRLLEWRPSADVRIAAPPGTVADLLHDVRTMAVGPLLALGTAAALALLRPQTLPLAGPVLLLWLLSPLLVWWIDRPLVPAEHLLDAAQTLFLRRLSRRTWAFFDAHVGAADNQLPPDNIQEHPVVRVAHRTSPTNMGFALLATLAARDFGYLTLRRLLARIDAAMTTMEAMDRHRGHFYNWYDTETLQPLRPRYVSTVDSGNLAGQLLTLRAGLLALADAPLLAASWLDGIHDTLGVLRESLETRLEASHRRSIAVALAAFEDALERQRAEPPQGLAEWRKTLRSLHRMAIELRAAIDAGAVSPPTTTVEGAAAVETDADALAAGATEAVASADDASYWAGALLRDARAGLDEIEELLPEAGDAVDGPLPTLRVLAGRAGAATASLALQTIESLAERAGALAEMDQSFLYDESRHLMTIGYNVDERRPDAGYYDLLASEARLGIFVAIAQGRIAQESWFALGRLLTSAAGEPVLLSWSGSMFEYLMPMLIMPSYAHTLLDQTCRGAVQRQIEYGTQRGVPWGVSESGYNATDTALNYQYRAFGVPGLGLKRGLADDVVVAPYASMMALMVAPEEACTNLQRLAAEGAWGRYGFYEAIDYTTSRLPRGQPSAVVRSYMAHHQGMGLLALANLLLDRPMQRRFAADPRLQATLLLLQERVPRVTVFQPDIDERAGRRSVEDGEQSSVRVVTELDAPSAEVQLLSNGRYHVMISDAGAGYSRWKELAVSRWREDGTVDAMGSFCYLRDLVSGALWSTAYQPTRKRASRYEAIFSVGRAEFRRRDEGIDTHTEIVVSPEDDIELRRVRLTNSSRAQRTIEVTTYSEVVLAPAIADALHPAFSKLFVQTEIVEHPAAILCTRRQRSPDDSTPWMFQLVAVHGARSDSGETRASAISHETDRARFIGRGRGVELPQALVDQGPLSNTVGSVLDPIAASRCVLTIDPDQTVTIDVVVGTADRREACLAMAGKYQDRRLADRVFELAWTHAQVVLRQLNASEADAELYGRLAGAVIHAHAALRADPAVLARNRHGQSGLWGYAISGDLPIVLLQIGSADNIELVRQLVQAHAWWRLKGLAVDLVIWNEERDIYRQRLHEQITGLIVGGAGAHVIDRPGGIFVRHVEQIAPEDRTLMQAVARAVFSDTRGTLAEQVQRRPLRERRPPALVTTRNPEPRGRAAARTVREDDDAASVAALRRGGRRLILENGIGGFAADGREYVVSPPAGERPPAPWVNVIANPRFGCVVSEAGSAYTWCENAHELRLTPWHNDPISDDSGEAIYLRDEETGQVWSPTSLPCPTYGDSAAPYLARHGFGSSVFEHTAYGIRSELEVFVALDAAVKISVLRLTNVSGRPRKLSATGYVEWVLGDLRAKSAPHIITTIATDTGAIYARNPYSNDYADWLGFLDVDDAQRAGTTFTCDRAEFIGRNGSLRSPAALARTRLSGRFGAALDPCAAFQVPVSLLDGDSTQVVFRLGIGRSVDEADDLVQAFRGAAAAQRELERVREHWSTTLGTVQVRTPEPALDVLVNGWLLYQTIACRIWARSGFYQSGGAFGFRDQLQDAMALVHARPEMLRAQLLLCASRQFPEGDVHHWWHPPQGRGVRTHISDDYLWLPLALARYVEATGDVEVLAETAPYLHGRPVNPHDESYYDLPGHAQESSSVYEHALRALNHGLRFGAHGLPLMGSGDWNDGMNLVGHGGRGESVWLGFFLAEVLERFAALATRKGDDATAARCMSERAKLHTSLETHGWDGAWYRRAYFDDGTPLGSAGSAECQIDSVAQSWAVLSGVADAARARQAMASLHERLVRADAGLVQLLDPPFDQRGPNPGYIAGYVPGVRENGGQYTHGAIWATMALAALGERERAWALLEMINPVAHGSSAEGVARYKVEPYVMAADVYSVAPHTGRGGWSWYTGSAGWMYRLVVESLLGIRLVTSADGARLVVAPCLPAAWAHCTVQYRYRATLYEIEVLQHDGDGERRELRLDGVLQAGDALPVVDDRHLHRVQLILRPRSDAASTAERRAPTLARLDGETLK